MLKLYIKYSKELNFGLNIISVDKVKSSGFLRVAVKSDCIVVEVCSRKSCLSLSSVIVSLKTPLEED